MKNKEEYEMGFMDKVKTAAKNADEKLGNAIDCEKIDSKIRDEEKKIKDTTVEMGEKVLANLRAGEEIDKAALDALYDKVKECEANIEKFKAEKESIKNKDSEEAKE